MMMPWHTNSWVRDSGNAVKSSIHKKPLMASAPSSYEPFADAEIASFASFSSLVESKPEPAAELTPPAPATFVPVETPILPTEEAPTMMMPWHTNSWVRDDGNAVKKSIHEKPLMGSASSSYEPASRIPEPAVVASSEQVSESFSSSNVGMPWSTNPWSQSDNSVKQSKIEPSVQQSTPDNLWEEMIPVAQDMPWNTASWTENKDNGIKKSLHQNLAAVF
mmetsp:Transcript_16238/g.24730  ORF Transcript_16238/g.24730 Transcript_16238/m.24730 type:complete len:220 (-) Transcript_16238:167-826(-)